MSNDLRINDSWMQTVDGDASSIDSFVQFVTEKIVGEFALTISFELPIRSFTVQVFSVDASESVGQPGYEDDSAWRRCFQKIEQQVCKQEVPEMVGAELHFKSVFRERSRAAHDASVVDQNIKLGFELLKLLDEVVDRINRRKIEQQEVNFVTSTLLLDFLQSCFCSFSVATRDVNFAPATRQADGSFFPDARIRSSYDHNLAIDLSVFLVRLAFE